MRRNINVQDSSKDNINNINNNRGKSNNVLNNNNFNSKLNNNYNKNTNLNRNSSTNKFGNINLNTNQRNFPEQGTKNFKNIKGINQAGIPNSAVISTKNFAIFQNQDYFNLDNFNYYGNQNQSNNNRNVDFNINNQNNFDNNQGNNQVNYNPNIIKNNFSEQQTVNNRKPNTTTVKSQIHFDDYSAPAKNQKNIASDNGHFSNNQIQNKNHNNQNFNNPNNNNYTINNKNLVNRDNNVNYSNHNRGNHNQNNNNNTNNNQNNQNKAYSKTILVKIKAAKTNGIINISNMNLISLPREIFDDTVRFDDVNWWELVDIKKIDASNNQIDESFNNENISFEAIPNLNYLKFSGNNFTTIPDSIYSLYSLKLLDFSDNKLRNLSDNIRGLKSLVDLNLSNNAITNIPNEIGKLTELELLNVSQNKISIIPQGIGNILKLKRLDLSNNFLEIILSQIGSLYNLEELILSKNKIKQIQPGSLARLSNLKYLDLHNNNLDSFSEIPNSIKLDCLILGYNRIVDIVNLRHCPNLTVLDINNNKLENFPEEVLNLKNIITLNLMNNSINDIPPALCYLNKLVRLNIEGNPLRKINSKIRSSNAEQIKSYLKTRIVGNEDNDYNGNQQHNNPKNNIFNDKDIDHNNNVFDKADIHVNPREDIYQNMPSKESNVNLLNYYQNNYLKIMNLDIEKIPIENFMKFKIFNCVGLDLSNNKIKDLNFFDQLPVFNDIQEFKINLNRLTHLSPCIINFKNLRILEMKNNLITEFFDNINLQIYENNNIDIPVCKINNNTNILNNKITNNFHERNKTNNLLINEEDSISSINNKPFPNLEYLDLSNNKIKNFPIILKFCTKLNSILISNNMLTSLDSLREIKNSNLFTLELGANKITLLPDKLYQNIPNIKHIGIENNDIKNVPTDLCFLKNLNKITLMGNPIKLLRANIINGGTKSILEYLRKMHRFTDEEMLMEGEKSNFLNFGNQPEEKISNKKRVYKNEQSPMEMEVDNNHPLSPMEKNKGKFNSETNNIKLNNKINDSVKEFGNVDIDSQFKNNDIFNMNQISLSENKIHKVNDVPLAQNNQNNYGSHQEELEDVNNQILFVESEMNEGNLPMFKKTDLRKKLNVLIRRRANIMKNL